MSLTLSYLVIIPKETKQWKEKLSLPVLTIIYIANARVHYVLVIASLITIWANKQNLCLLFLTSVTERPKKSVSESSTSVSVPVLGGRLYIPTGQRVLSSMSTFPIRFCQNIWRKGQLLSRNNLIHGQESWKSPLVVSRTVNALNESN